jgi:hypothetical protein
MKTREILALLGAAVLMLTQLAYLVIRNLSMEHILDGGGKPPTDLILATTYLLGARGMITLAVHLAVAGWMVRFAARRNARPWVWGGFAFLFGLVAPVVFIFAEMVALKWTPGRRVAS